MKKQLRKILAEVLAVATLCLTTPINDISTNSLALKSAYTASAETYGDLTYRISRNEITISDCSETATEVVIPSEIDGLPVTNIAYAAFYNCLSLTSVKISDSVTNIELSAFWGCSSLTTIEIPDSVTSIGKLAFFGCSSLTSITIPESVTSIGERVFWYCSSLDSIIVDENNQYYRDVDSVLFNKDETTLIQYPIGRASKEYKISNSISNIGDYAFYGCSNLTSITIPNSVASIEKFSFYDCTGLVSIIVDEDNPYYSDIDGVLSNKDKTTIIQYPSSKPLEIYAIPDSVTSIGYSAFNRSLNLISITIPYSVTNIDALAFSDCSTLETITIPNSVTNIGNQTFYKCSKIKTITIPDSITIIGNGVFLGCTKLTELIIPDSVTYIDDTDVTSYCKIYGYKGSTAESYANEYKLTFIALDDGDLNADRILDSADIEILKKVIYGKQKLSPNQAKSADINGDGKINVFDLTLLKRNITK